MDQSRRNALKKLGVGTSVAWAAPAVTVLVVPQHAHATSSSGSGSGSSTSVFVAGVTYSVRGFGFRGNVYDISFVTPSSAAGQASFTGLTTGTLTRITGGDNFTTIDAQIISFGAAPTGYVTATQVTPSLFPNSLVIRLS